jgi:RHS repeat-associated protein
LSFTFDGFGNRLTQAVTAGSAPAATFNYSATTNRITTAGFGYDANGNMTTVPSVTGVTYDIENRTLTAGGKTYRYTQSGQRIYMNSGTAQEMYYYGVDGRKLGTYQPAVNFNSGTGQWYVSFTTMNKNVYFNGRLIVSNNQVVVTDRLGSVRANAATGARFNYYPYGEEYTTTTQSREKFATYYRDASGLDYANQRYYRSIHGGFLTPDPYRASGGPADPGSWNRYAYVGGDPVNFYDPAGLIKGLPDPFGIPDDVVVPGAIAGWVPLVGVAPMSNGGVPAYAQLSTGGSGGPSGIGIAIRGLKTISAGDFQNKAKCRAFFDALAAQLAPELGITGQMLMKEVVKAANEAASEGWVFNGATANDPKYDQIDSTRFAGVYFVGTIGQLFQSSSGGLYALSQVNGSAIWINTTFFKGQGQSAYALGVLMHELLHKNSVGGGFSHDIGMPLALDAIGAPAAKMGQTQGVSSRIGQICF